MEVLAKEVSAMEVLATEATEAPPSIRKTKPGHISAIYAKKHLPDLMH